MRARYPLLSAILLFTAIPVARASPGAAAEWSPPSLTRAAPSPATRAPAETVPTPLATAATPAHEATEKAPTRPRSCKKAGCRSRWRPKVDPRLLAARTQRARLLATAEPMLTGSRPGEGARMLGVAAAAQADPILYLAAAQAELMSPKLDDASLARALRLTHEAQRLISAPTDLRIAPSEGPALNAEANALTAYITQRSTQLRLRGRGRAELASGAVLMVLGAAGLGVLTSGAALSSRVDTARDVYTGQDANYLDGLDRSKRRADNLLAAGMITGLFGAALGIPLTAIGARDLKRSRTAGSERPNLRMAPGLAGISLSGKF